MNIWTYVFKTAAGEQFEIRACDLKQARVLAYAKGDPQYYRADLIKFHNR